MESDAVRVAAAVAAAAVAAVVGEVAAAAVGLATPTLVHTPSAAPFRVASVGLSPYLFRDPFHVQELLPLAMIVGAASLGLSLEAHNQKLKSDDFECWSANAAAGKNLGHEWTDLEKLVIRWQGLRERVRLPDLNRMVLIIKSQPPILFFDKGFRFMLKQVP